MSLSGRVSRLLASSSFPALGLWSAVASAEAPPCSVSGGLAPGEVALESRLIAPCCDSPQTLDVHQSPTALALRTEIHERLCAGEASAAIEADLVRRYGETILAGPRDGLSSVAVPLVGSVVLLSSAALVIVSLRRWRRRSEALGAALGVRPAAPPARDAEDDRLDEELRRLDGVG